jgi:hypothetical protein
MAELLSPLSKA